MSADDVATVKLWLGDCCSAGGAGVGCVGVCETCCTDVGWEWADAAALFVSGSADVAVVGEDYACCC